MTYRQTGFPEPQPRVIWLRAGHPEAENVPDEDYAAHFAIVLRFQAPDQDFAKL